MNDCASALRQIVNACQRAETTRRFSGAVSDIHRIAAQALLDQRDIENGALLRRVQGERVQSLNPDAFRARREALGLTQPQLANLLTTSVWNVRNWEQGRHAIPAHLHLALYALEHDPPPGYEPHPPLS